MPEFRRDPVIGRWVIISTDRGKRPSSFGNLPKQEEPKMCPFCPGNESSTPPEVLAFRENGSQPNKPGWFLRVISNKYPALRVEGNLNREPKGLYDKMNGVGAHEVIIETPGHYKDLADLSHEEIKNVLWAYRERSLDLRRDRRFKYVLIFKNHGEAAGASLEHSHSQLIATPIIPRRVEEEIDGANRYYDFKERCIFCDIIRQELTDKERIISDYGDFIAFSPFASRHPFETWLLPKQHMAHLTDMAPGIYIYLAEALKDLLNRLRVALNNPPFNFIIHTAPFGEEYDEVYHWHFEVIPKLTKVAGFEWGSGFYINPTKPEDAAAYMREIDSSQAEKLFGPKATAKTV
ncbi:MAG: galactose-1-phosphate uridylyltransferase [Candidatus Zixiibacteriota bacterium]|nr:MAG: galactose-1-phosphate uridylyltransferase [candidate division Zixibacteria bacterium]